MALTVRQVKLARLLPERFIPHCRIQQGEGGPPIPFDLWDFQLDALHEIERQSRIIFLKARQLGLSWLTLAYMLWLVSCNEGQTCLILNRGLREAIELLDRVRFMHRRLPPQLRVPLVKDVVDHLEFANGSRIYSLPATEFAGSGITAQLVMIDEWAKIRGITRILTSLLPTLSAGGKLIGISTAYGFHNPFAGEWRKAISGLSRFFPLFIPWDAHPDRDEAWYDIKREEMPTERELHQEYPSEWLDAFQLPGESVFRDEFDRARHVLGVEHDPETQWPQVRGIDFGYHHSIHQWAQIEQQRHVYVYAELHAERKTTRSMMERVIEMDAELGVETYLAPAGCDPAGKAQTSQATESDHFTVESFGVNVNAEVVTPRDRVTLIKQLLEEDRLHVHNSCEFLIEALEQAQWAKAAAPMGSAGEPIPKETYEKDGYYEHPLDTLGYLLINVFRVTGQAVGAATERAKPATSGKKKRYSDSDYG